MARAIVIGAGHNGLVAAARLANAGHEVTVLEQRDSPGGLAAGRAFHPGYSHTGILHDSATFSPVVEKALGLDLKRGTEVTTFLDAETSWRSGPDPKLPNTAAWKDYQSQIAEIRAYAAHVLAAAPPRTDSQAPLWPLAKTALGFRRLGNATMMELLRIGPAAVDDWLAEFFTDPVLRGGLALGALHGTWMGPRSPTSTATLLLQESLRSGPVIGGPAAIITALIEAVNTAGATIRCGARVTRIRTGTAVEGVEMEGGERLDAEAIFLACDPKHALLDLVDPLALPPALERDISDVRSRGIAAKVHLALRAMPSFPATPNPTAHMVAAGKPLELERAFDAVKYRRFANWLPLDIRIPTLESPSLAPAGHHVLSILVHGVPFTLDEGWSDTTRATLGRVVLESLETIAPGVSQLVVAQETLSPADLATGFGLPQGHLWHGEHAIDQLFVARPFLGSAQYQTSIRGLYLAGSGAHPGGGITGLPGWLGSAAL